LSIEVKRKTERGLLESLGFTPIGAFLVLVSVNFLDEEEACIFMGLVHCGISSAFCFAHIEGKLIDDPSEANKLFASGDLDRRKLWYGDGGFCCAIGVEGEDRKDSGEGGNIVVGVLGALWDSN